MRRLFNALVMGFGVFIIAVATVRLFVRPTDTGLSVAQILAGVLITLIPTARNWFLARVPQRPSHIRKLPNVGVVGAFVLILGFYLAASVGLLELRLKPATVAKVARTADITMALGLVLSGIGVFKIWFGSGGPRPLPPSGRAPSNGSVVGQPASRNDVLADHS